MQCYPEATEENFPNEKGLQDTTAKETSWNPVQGEICPSTSCWKEPLVDGQQQTLPSWFCLCLHKGCYYSQYKEPGSCYYAFQGSGDCAWSWPSCSGNSIWALCWQWPNNRNTINFAHTLEIPREKQSSHFRGKVRDLVASIQTPIFFAFAVCQKDSRSANMARNIKCGEWYHKTCTNIPKTVISRRRETWACKTVNRCDCIMHTYDESLLNIIHDC